MKTAYYILTGTPEDESILQEAGAVIRRGGLVAFPTETVYGLGGNGLDPEASAKIYAAKGRPSDNPLILHIASEEELLPLVKRVPAAARVLMDNFWPGPMTLIFEKSDIVPKATTGGLDTVAVRMPSHPGARAFIRAAGVPIAAPSANKSGRPSTTTAAHVKEDLDGTIDMILDGGPSDIGLESTIIDLTGSEPMILRPGYIGREKLEQVLGSIAVDPTVYTKSGADLRPKAPGMKYRHYAPKAEVVLFSGEAEKVAAAILARAEESRAQGYKTGILCSDETRRLYGTAEVITLGSRFEDTSIAHSLFDRLRQLDTEGMERVFSEVYADGPMGEAIMNRLRKAAGYHIENV